MRSINAKHACLTGLFALAATSALAAPVVLSFEGIIPYPAASDVFVQQFYNGGTSSNGSAGTNYGIEFSANALALCLNSADVVCSNSSHGGMGDPSSAQTGLFFLDGDATYMNVAAGFDTGFSFLYTAANFGGIVNVFDGLNGTGNLLASLALDTTPTACAGDYNAAFCPFVAIGVAFSGTAMSVSFGGVANQVVFDDITFGSITPGDTGAELPEPASLALVGLALAGAGWARRRAKSA
jgi:hypothetical protein